MTLKRIQRNRRLTPEEAAKYRKVREQIAQELPELVARHHERTRPFETIEKLLPLQTLKPGQYTLKMRVTDRNRNQTLTPSATFTVT